MLELLSGFKLTGLRARLFAVVLLAAVPLAVLLFAYATVLNTAQQDRARAEVQTHLEADIGALQDLVSQARATLVTFGITYAIQAHRWDLAQGNAERLGVEHPEYATIAATDEKGDVHASNPRISRPVNVSGDESFKRAVATRQLVVSDYRPDPITGKPAISVTLPVYDAKDKLVAVEWISFDPARLGQRLRSAGPDAAELLIDSRGTVVTRRPTLRGIDGTNASSVPFVQTILSERKGRAEVAGLDRIVRSYYFAPVSQDATGPLYLTLGISEAQLLADQQRAFTFTLLGFGVFTVLALIAAGIMGTYSLYRPARKLEETAERMAEGDLSARVDLGDRTDEFGTLGREFNTMAGAVERHVADLEKTRGELRVLNLELEERVRRRTAELEASNKELEAFSYSVSHDLRSPLRAIDGFSRELAEDYAEMLDEQGRQDLARVRENANRMAELIDSLLKLSRLNRQEMKVRTVDMSALAGEVARCLEEAEPEREVDFRVQQDVTGRGDPALLRIVLENLMSNAWKFTSRHDSALIEFGTQDSNGEAAYYVRDNGAGFDMAYAGKLFGAFQRVHGQDEFPGIGIGLATTARIVHRHGGRIWAEGEPDKGATFFFTLS